jgi:hypothetical protein
MLQQVHSTIPVSKQTVYEKSSAHSLTRCSTLRTHGILILKNKLRVPSGQMAGSVLPTGAANTYVQIGHREIGKVNSMKHQVDSVKYRLIKQENGEIFADR